MNHSIERGHLSSQYTNSSKGDAKNRDLNLESVYKKASAYLSNRRINRIDLNNPKYAGEYDPKRLDQIYQKEIQNYNKQFENQPESKKLSIIQEAMINDGVASHNLLGGNFDAMKISPFDDERHGLDLMLLHHKQNPDDSVELETYCGVDLTYSPSDYVDKIQNLIYRMDDNPGAHFRTEIFLDEKSESSGSRLTPYLIIHNDIEALENMIPEWEKTNEIKKDSSVDLDMMVQSWLQATYFEQLPDDETEVGAELIGLYQANAKIFEELILQKSKQYDLSPYVENSLEQLATATKTPINTLRKFIIPRDDQSKPGIHRLIWGY